MASGVVALDGRRPGRWGRRGVRPCATATGRAERPAPGGVRGAERPPCARVRSRAVAPHLRAGRGDGRRPGASPGGRGAWLVGAGTAAGVGHRLSVVGLTVRDGAGGQRGRDSDSSATGLLPSAGSSDRSPRTRHAKSMAWPARRGTSRSDRQRTAHRSVDSYLLLNARSTILGWSSRRALGGSHGPPDPPRRRPRSTVC